MQTTVETETRVSRNGHRQRTVAFYGDWGFWGFVCGVVTLFVTVALSVYIYEGQRADSLAQFRSDTRLAAIAIESLPKRVLFLRGMLSDERVEARRGVLESLISDFESQKLIVDVKSLAKDLKNLATKLVEKADGEPDPEARKLADDTLKSAQSAEAAVAALVIENQQRIDRQEAAARLIEREQARWQK